MYGSEIVSLEGFDTEPMPGSWMRPALRFVSADLSPAGGIAAEMDARAQAIRWTRRGIGIMFVIGLMSCAFWFGVGGRPAPAEASSQWFIAGVGAQGVVVNTGSVALLIAPGEKLPNGETLQAVVPERSTYITDHATVVVQKSAVQPAAAAGPSHNPIPVPTSK